MGSQRHIEKSGGEIHRFFDSDKIDLDWPSLIKNIRTIYELNYRYQ